MKKILLIAISLIIVFLSGCTEKSINNEISNDNEKVAEEFINSKGYEIVEFKGELEKYTLDKNKLVGSEGIPYSQMWAVQEIEPDIYFGKEIEIYEFLVEKHPLEEIYEDTTDGVNLYIMVCDNKIIGGYSYPNADVFGAYYSLEGKTLEEVTGLTFKEWQEEWENKYK